MCGGGVLLSQYAVHSMYVHVSLFNCSHPHVQIYDGKAAQTELKGLFDVMAKSSQKFENDLVRHNVVLSLP